MIKVMISLLNFLGIRYQPCATFFRIPGSQFALCIVTKVYNSLPWQHRDYRTITALSLGLRPHELGQLSMIIPHNHGITITYVMTKKKFEWHFSGGLRFLTLEADCC